MAVPFLVHLEDQTQTLVEIITIKANLLIIRQNSFGPPDVDDNFATVLR